MAVLPVIRLANLVVHSYACSASSFSPHKSEGAHAWQYLCHLCYHKELKSTPFRKFQRRIEREMDLPAGRLRFWNFTLRENETRRPNSVSNTDLLVEGTRSWGVF
eukprot:g5333.t1